MDLSNRSFAAWPTRTNALFLFLFLAVIYNTVFNYLIGKWAL